MWWPRLSWQWATGAVITERQTSGFSWSIESLALKHCWVAECRFVERKASIWHSTASSLPFQWNHAQELAWCFDMFSNIIGNTSDLVQNTSITRKLRADNLRVHSHSKMMPNFLKIKTFWIMPLDSFKISFFQLTGCGYTTFCKRTQQHNMELSTMLKKQPCWHWCRLVSTNWI